MKLKTIDEYCNQPEGTFLKSIEDERNLIDGVEPHPEVDEAKLKALWEKGRKAWSGISSPTEWVEKLREP